jgi:hypothetical protein
MNRVGRRLVGVAAVIAGLALPASAAAQATRTWVSGVGDDANPCSRTAPCKTWAGAITKTAQGGEIDALDAGGFGSVTITKSITLSATGVTGGVLASSSPGIVINTSSDTSPGDADRDAVTLRGLDINGGGLHGEFTPGTIGVNIIHAGVVRLENDQIYGFSQNAVQFAPTATTEAGAPAPTLMIENSILHDNGQNGVLALPPPGQTGNVVIENSQIEGNGCGIAAGLSVAATFSPATCGTAATGSGTLSVASTNTSSSNNTGAGVQSDGATVTNWLSGDSIIGNGIGLQALSNGKIISVGANNSVFGNTADGTPTSTVTTGAVGPAGATGLTGTQGPSGKIELVTCKTVTVTVKKKIKGKTKKVKKTEQKCTGKTVSGTVKFTASGTIVKATLSRGRDVYATGMARMGSTRTEGALQVRRKLTAGRYTLTLFKGSKLVARRTVHET